jgi:hypothetical protein
MRPLFYEKLFLVGPGYREVACVIAFMTVLLGAVTAGAEDGRTVYVPMTFHTEAQEIRTSACLQVEEHVYTQAAWWEDSSGSGSASAAERALKGVIAAIRGKDRAALLRLSDPKESSDSKRFDEQAGAFFQQFDALEIVGVPRAYMFDGFAVFYGRFRSPQHIFFAPFVFVHENDGTFGFLPTRTDKPTYHVVDDWFNAPWGAGSSSKPAYCSDEDVKRATHRIALAASSAATAWRTSQLLFIGAPLDKPGELSGLATKIKSTVDEMKTALNAGKIDDFARHMTLEGGGRLKQWFTSADETDRNKYKTAFLQQQPFYFFDTSPLLVVYTKLQDGTVQVLYFTVGNDKGLLWTNSSHVTVSDKIFKRGALYNAASQDKPFSSIASQS